MTQQKQLEFTESLEAALCWMRAVQERLRANDNTQGPRGALEARLRETEKIHQSEHEGRLKVDKALVAAENLLQSGDEELKTQTNAKLKDLKGQWDETSTYIIHCHSRIEWVWLHWAEFLKAREEFELWLTSRQRGLDVAVELQLGLKEKLWLVDQQRVVLSDVQGQAALLERLLDEASALHNRTQDPSVDSEAQESLQEAYNTVRDQAQERLALLQKMAEEHVTYQNCVQRFQSWLLQKTKELTDLMERDDTAENKLKALQALDDNVAGEEKTLQYIEGLAEGVRSNTSPSGAELVVEEAEELRLGWQRLRQGLCETEEGLQSSLDSHSQYAARCQRLGEDIGHFRTLLQGLDQELVQSLEDRDCRDQTEEQMVGQWRKYTGVRNTLAGEESQVELLKAQLKELFRFSQDSRHLSDDVLAVVKEHQSVKCRATRLCSESESGLRNFLQDPLLVYTQWSLTVSQVLETSAEVADFSHIAMLVQSIERLLKDSVQLQERLSLLQVKGDLLDSVFGPDRSDGLQTELSAAIRNRELLHTQLLQRKSRLQGLISRTKDFGDAYEMIRSKLTGLREQLIVTDGLQPDILAKKSQSDQFMVILKDLEDCEAHITALETLVSSSHSNRTQFERLYADWRILHKAARVKVRESEDSITDHEGFHERLLNMEKWLMIMKQKLESFHSSSGEWSIVGRRHEAQRALGEFPEKELQLQQMEVKGQGVLERTSDDGQIHIVRDIKRLRDSWLSLYNMSLNLHRLLNSSSDQTDRDSEVSLRDRDSVAGSLSADRTLTSEIRDRDGQIEAGDFSSQKHQQQQDDPAGKSESRSGPGRGSVEEHEGQVIGHLLLTVQDDELSPFEGDQVDSWSVSSRTGFRNVSYSDAGGGVLVVAGDGDGAGTASTTTLSRGERRRVSSAEGNMEAGESLSPGAGGAGGGGGGGAFTLFRRDQTKPPSATPKQDGKGTSGEYRSRRREFEAWLSKENELLSGIFSTKGTKLSTKEVQTRQDTLRALRADVAWGQDQFQMLLQEGVGSDAGSGSAEDASLEELRYRWMLYKSKLKDAGDVRARAKRVRAKQEEPAVAAKVQKRPGLLQRVCRLALPLWFLLLALLLFAFLLPFMDEGNSCSLSNNFARSFNIMLRYNGPPPT